MRDRVLLFYDADCGLCTFFRNLVLRLDVRRRIVSIPIGSNEADPYLGDLDEDRRWASMHVVGANGVRSSAGPGFLELLAVLPLVSGLGRLLGAKDSGRRLAHGIYRFTVRLRAGLAG